MKIILMFALITMFGMVQAQEFNVLTASDGSFSITMPGNPSSEKKKIETSNGPITIYEMAISHNGVAYRAAYLEGPAMGDDKGRNREQLNKIRDSIAGSPGRAILSEEDITVNGHPGKLVKLSDNDNAILAFKYCIANGRLYQAIATVNWKDYPANQKNIDTFINSLNILTAKSN